MPPRRVTVAEPARSYRPAASRGEVPALRVQSDSHGCVGVDADGNDVLRSSRACASAEVVVKAHPCRCRLSGGGCVSAADDQGAVAVER